jgi:hypothetical protein
VRLLCLHANGVIPIKMMPNRYRLIAFLLQIYELGPAWRREKSGGVRSRSKI